ncbi:MAG: hypothetical protein J0L52_12820 [Caulobacterales bacterium]|nr:hypothetical protein [Caulobacterales bacterium]
MRYALSILAALALAGCEPAAEESPAATDDAAPAASTSAGNEGAEVPVQLVALDSEGLRLVDEATGSTRLIPFGSPKDEVVTTMAAAVGAAIEQGAMDECGPGPLTFTEYINGLRLWFSAGGFSGWESTGEVTTMDGLSAAANRAELEAAGITEFTRDTLEDEFEAGGVFGMMEPGGQEVALLYVGDNCFMR